MFVYSFYNRKTGSFETPITEPVAKDIYPKMVCRGVVLHPDEARRNFRYECELYYLGTWDEETCIFDLLPKPEFLVSLAPYEVKEDVKA